MHRRSIAFIVLLAAAASAFAQFAPQKSSLGGVSVDVTPVELGCARAKPLRGSFAGDFKP